MLFAFQIGQVNAIMTADDSEHCSTIDWSGPTDQIERIKAWLETANGPFGHAVINGNGEVRPGDFAFALSLSKFSWQMNAGTIIPYQSAPEGAVS